MTSWNVFGERFSCLLGTSGRFAVFSHCLTVFVCPSFRVRNELISCLLGTSCRCAGFSLYHGFLLFVRFYEEWADHLIARNSDRCAIFFTNGFVVCPFLWGVSGLFDCSKLRQMCDFVTLSDGCFVRFFDKKWADFLFARNFETASRCWFSASLNRFIIGPICVLVFID